MAAPNEADRLAREFVGERPPHIHPDYWESVVMPRAIGLFDSLIALRDFVREEHSHDK